MSQITSGTRVRWTSQAGGRTKTKEGVVVFTRDEARKDPELTGRRADWPGQIANLKFRNHRRMFDGHSWLDSDGVLVEVRDGKTDRARPKLYMPFTSNLEIVQ